MIGLGLYTWRILSVLKAHDLPAQWTHICLSLHALFSQQEPGTVRTVRWEGVQTFSKTL